MQPTGNILTHNKTNTDMPHGELFIRTHKATVGRDADGYVDAFDRYGLSLANGAASQLLMAAPAKEPTGNSNALSHGVAYMADSVNVKDEHRLSLEAHIYAASEADFYTKLDLFNSEVCDLDRGEFIRIKRKSHPRRVYRVLYQNFQQFTTFNMEMAEFVWTLKEPHPELRDVAPPNNRRAVVAVVETDGDLDALIQVDGFLQDGDLAVVTNPASGKAANTYLRIYEEDGAISGGPIWSIYDETIQNGDSVKNIIDGNYWEYIEPGVVGSGKWKKHWY